MKHPSQDAADFVARLTALAGRLAANNIVVGSLRAEWSSFGCWSLEVENGQEALRYQEGLLGPDPLLAIGPEAVRVFWDGKDKFLSVRSSPTRPLSAPNQWAVEFEKRIEEGPDEVIRFVEEYLTNRLLGDK